MAMTALQAFLANRGQPSGYTAPPSGSAWDNMRGQQPYSGYQQPYGQQPPMTSMQRFLADSRHRPQVAPRVSVQKMIAPTTQQGQVEQQQQMFEGGRDGGDSSPNTGNYGGGFSFGGGGPTNFNTLGSVLGSSFAGPIGGIAGGAVGSYANAVNADKSVDALGFSNTPSDISAMNDFTSNIGLGFTGMGEPAAVAAERGKAAAANSLSDVNTQYAGLGHTGYGYANPTEAPSPPSQESYATNTSYGPTNSLAASLSAPDIFGRAAPAPAPAGATSGASDGPSSDGVPDGGWSGTAADVDYADQQPAGTYAGQDSGGYYAGGDTTGEPDGGGGGGDGGGTVICTALYSQGLLPLEVFKADIAYGKTMDPAVLAGYRKWATPIAKLMERNRTFAAIMAPITVPWAQHMYGNKNWLGALYLKVGVPICRMIGAK